MKVPGYRRQFVRCEMVQKAHSETSSTAREGVRGRQRRVQPSIEGNSATIQAALSAIGGWSDLNWDEAVAELDRLRHEQPPTPPME